MDRPAVLNFTHNLLQALALREDAVRIGILQIRPDSAVEPQCSREVVIGPDLTTVTATLHEHL